MSKRTRCAAGIAVAGVVATSLVALSPTAANAYPTGACKANHRGSLCILVDHGKVKASWLNDKGGPNTITIRVINADVRPRGTGIVKSVHKKAVPYGVLVTAAATAGSGCTPYYATVTFANGGHSRTGTVIKAGC